MNEFAAVFFDLDGTLVDTAPDMGLALNLLLEDHNLNTFAMEDIRPHVSHGSSALIKLGFNINETDQGFEILRAQFLNLYEHNIAVNSKLFEGMEQILEDLEQASIPWGIVTNKPGYLTQNLLRQLQLDHRVSSLISGDSLKHRKPHPQPLITACEKVSKNPRDCLYVGDAQRDIQSAHAAGMMSCAALYGYYTSEENPLSWDADIYINSAMELRDHIIFKNNQNLSHELAQTFK